MKWSTTYAIGLPPLDEHHQMFFRLIDDFRVVLDLGASGITYGLFLDLLTRHSQTHFSAEEQAMEQYHCPMAQQNTEDHAQFLALLGHFSQRYEVSGYQPADARALLTSWISSCLNTSAASICSSNTT